MAGQTVSRCGECGATLAEPPDIAAEKRVPCPECGSTRRTILASATLMANVTVTASAAAARASAPAPRVVMEQLEDVGFSVTWLRLSDDGAWMVRVFDREGAWLDGALADDPQEAILAVSERLLPPEPAK